jgi:hypothetical protein
LRSRRKMRAGLVRIAAARHGPARSVAPRFSNSVNPKADPKSTMPPTSRDPEKLQKNRMSRPRRRRGQTEHPRCQAGSRERRQPAHLGSSDRMIRAPAARSMDITASDPSRLRPFLYLWSLAERGRRRVEIGRRPRPPRQEGCATATPQEDCDSPTG